MVQDGAERFDARGRELEGEERGDLVAARSCGVPAVRGVSDAHRAHDPRCCWPNAEPDPLRNTMAAMIPLLEFGRTGHHSTRTIFGAAALGNVTQAEADNTMELIRRTASITSTRPATVTQSSRIGPDGHPPDRPGDQDRRAKA